MPKTGPKKLSARQRVATNLRVMRLAQGLSQEELAHRAGVHRTYLGSVERGERNVSIDSIERLAGALGIDVGELVRLPGPRRRSHETWSG